MKLLPFLLLIIITSCHVSRNVQTSHINTDSLVAHVRDSSAQVLKETSESYNEMIKEITSSSVTFENEPCPNQDSVLALLDSIGKINYRNMLNTGVGTSPISINSSGVRNIHFGNSVKIGADGSIEASGRIKTANFSNNKLTEENHLLAIRNDSLWRVVDSQRVEFSKKADVKTVVVKKTFIPWWLWCIAGLGFVLWFYKLIPKRPI